MQPQLCEPQRRDGLQFRVREAEDLAKTRAMEAAEEAGPLSMAADRTGRLLRPPTETPEHLGVTLWRRGMLRCRRVVRRPWEPAMSS